MPQEVEIGVALLIGRRLPQRKICSNNSPQFGHVLRHVIAGCHDGRPRQYTGEY